MLGRAAFAFNLVHDAVGTKLVTSKNNGNPNFIDNSNLICSVFFLL